MKIDNPELNRLIQDTEFWRQCFGDAYLFRKELDEKESSTGDTKEIERKN